jgi:hypothetical protein
MAKSRKPGHQEPLPTSLRSACAEASLHAEIERVKMMTVEQRVLSALSMKRRFSWIEPTPKTRI